MTVSDLSLSTQNYLKAIWSLSEWSTAPITPTLIAEKTGLKISSVSEAMRKLASQGLVENVRYGDVSLTDQGRGYAIAMVRRHRLIESFLVDTLGYGWEQVHDEAEHLEHAVSDFMIDRIEEFLGFPTRDPHGDPIPSADGRISLPEASPLAEVDLGTRVTVERISDDDPELLQYFSEHGIVPGTQLIANEGAPFTESLDVSIMDVAGTATPTGAGAVRGTVTLGPIAANALYVSIAALPAEPGTPAR